MAERWRLHSNTARPHSTTRPQTSSNAPAMRAGLWPALIAKTSTINQEKLYGFVHDNPFSLIDEDGHQDGSEQVCTFALEGIACDAVAKPCQGCTPPIKADPTTVYVHDTFLPLPPTVALPIYQQSQTASSTSSAQAPSKDPCENATLKAAGVSARQQIITAQSYIDAWNGPFGALIGYFYAVHTRGPNDIKNLPGRDPHNKLNIAAGNISYGITCPFGAALCSDEVAAVVSLSISASMEASISSRFMVRPSYRTKVA